MMTTATTRDILRELSSATIEALVEQRLTQRLYDANAPAIRLLNEEPDVLNAVNETQALLRQFDSMILLDAIADHLGATAQTDEEKFQYEVLEHAITEIRKSRGLE